jgi:uncharacterized Rmd1/YagE family protein
MKILKLMNDTKVTFLIGLFFKVVSDKLEFISSSSKFYMESRHSKKSEIGEILIIILIATEIIIAVVHHSS